MEQRSFTDRFVLAALIVAIVISLAVLLGTPTLAHGQPKKIIKHDGHELQIEGQVETVEVERTVIVRDKLPLVKALPFTLIAPAGGTGYLWDVPPGVQFKRAKNKLTITSAPSGPLTISVEWSTAKLVNGGIEFEDHSGKLTLVVGELTPPVPPDPLAKELAALYAADNAADKLAGAQRLAALYRLLAKEVNSTGYTSLLSFIEFASNAVAALPGDPLPSIRARLRIELQKELPSDVETPLTADLRAKVSTLYSRFAVILEALTK